MSDTVDRDDPFEAIGYQRPSKEQESQPFKVDPEPLGCTTDSPVPVFSGQILGNQSLANNGAPGSPGLCVDVSQGKTRANREIPGDVNTTQERDEYGVAMKDVLTEGAPANKTGTGTGCTHCGGDLDSFSEARPRLTKVFVFCTACGVVVKVHCYRG